MQFASAVQAAMLVDSSNNAAVKQAAIRIARAANCINTKFDPVAGDKHPAAVGSELESITTNTKQRLLAYLAFNKALDGTSGTLPEGDTCE